MPVACLLDQHCAAAIICVTLQLGVFRNSRALTRPVRNGNSKFRKHLVQCHIPVFFLCRTAFYGDRLQEVARQFIQRIDKHEKLVGTHALRHKQNAAIELHHGDKLCILHPAKLEHPIRDNGISVSFDNLEFHMNLLFIFRPSVFPQMGLNYNLLHCTDFLHHKDQTRYHLPPSERLGPA